MKFKKIFFLEFLPYFFSTVLTILVALKIKEAWVVIAGIILNKILYVIMSYIITDYKFKLDFNLNIFKDLFDFGKWIFACINFNDFLSTRNQFIFRKIHWN